MSRGFDAYWHRLDQDLAAVPPAAHLLRDPYRSTDRFDFYTVRLSSIGMHGSPSYRIAAYLSVPTAPGLHPALLELPRHGSVNHTPHSHERERFVVLTVMHRGQRRADRPFRASYPGLLTLDITDPEHYVYRGIIADCLRGAEMLAAHPAVDTSRIGAVGDDLGIIVAARRPVFSALRVDSLLLAGALERSQSTGAYPLEEFNDLRRTRPDAVVAAGETLALFEPAAHARGVHAPTLISVPPAGPSLTQSALIAALGAPVVFTTTERDGLDADSRAQWLAERLGVPPMSRFLDGPIPLPGDPVLSHR